MRDLKGHALNPTTIEIEWKPPSAEGATPKHYKLFYVKVEPDSETDGDLSADDYATETEITVSRLQPDFPKQIRIITDLLAAFRRR